MLLSSYLPSTLSFPHSFFLVHKLRLWSRYKIFLMFFLKLFCFVKIAKSGQNLFMYSLRNHALKQSGSINDSGEVIWQLCLCLLLAWVTVYFCIWKGTASVGKVNKNNTFQWSIHSPVKYLRLSFLGNFWATKSC